jgi:hypothetical protein
MLNRSIFFAVIAATSFVIVGCGGGPAANSNTSANTNAASANSSNPLEPKKKDVEAVTNNAPTLTPVLKAYCDAKMKNDEAGLRKVYSSDTIKAFEADMKEEKVKTLIKFLEDDKVSDKLCKAENEKITGESATAKMFIDSYPNGLEVYFVKEGGEWKMTNRSPAFESVKQSNTAGSDSAKADSVKADTVKSDEAGKEKK